MNHKQLQEVIDACKLGDKEAFRDLMLEYTEYVFALAFRILRNDEDAKDAVQETFIKVWHNIDKYRKEVKLTTWIYKICTNLCFDRLKSKKRKPLVFNDDFESVFSSLLFENQDKSFDNKELALIIEELAEGLTPKQQLVFLLKDIQGFDNEEIVEITGLNKGQIKSNLYYARKEIREKLIKIDHEVC